MKDFKELHVWQKSHSLTLAVYKISKSFPKEELYGLTQVKSDVQLSPYPQIFPRVVEGSQIKN